MSSRDFADSKVAFDYPCLESPTVQNPASQHNHITYKRMIVLPTDRLLYYALASLRAKGPCLFLHTRSLPLFFANVVYGRFSPPQLTLFCSFSFPTPTFLPCQHLQSTTAFPRLRGLNISQLGLFGCVTKPLLGCSSWLSWLVSLGGCFMAHNHQSPQIPWGQ